ncbi:MAG: metallophosphoesterase [Bdellovibrionales bacterium]|nr:metallophosphoesterase [Bdellovibrionales bacterium]
MTNDLRLMLFIAMMIAVNLLAVAYIIRRLALHRDASPLVRRLALWHAVGAAVLLLSSRLVWRAVDEPHESWLVTAYQWASYSMMGYLATLLFLLMVRDGVNAARWLSERALALARRLGAGRAPAVRAPAPLDASRRRAIQDGFVLGVMGLSGGLTAAGVAQMSAGPCVEKVEVPIKGLPEPFDGYRIAQLSDVHVGPTVNRAFVEGLVETVNGLKPDAIVLTGDLVDGSVGQLGAAFDGFTGLSAPDGVFGCTGNHEYYAGVEQWMTRFAEVGIRMLQNEHVLVERGGARLAFAGVTDYSAERMLASHRTDPAAAARGIPAGTPSVLLAHQPRSCFEAEQHGFSLQLSGHTHAGQFYPFAFFVGLVHRYVKGLNRHGRMWVYVNKGTGYWGPPTRLGVPNEITELTLRRA